MTVADDYCYLTTTGRRTGRPHEIEIWYAADGDTLFLLAGGGRDSDWVRNLAADPRCTVRFDREPSSASLPATARLLDDPAAEASVGEADRARHLVFAKYAPRYGGDLTEWRGRALPVALDLPPAG